MESVDGRVGNLTRTAVLGVTTVLLVAVAAVVVVFELGSSEEGPPDSAPAPGSDASVQEIVIDSYRAPLLPDERPSDWMKYYPAVVLVEINGVDEPKVETIDGPAGGYPIVYTTFDATALEYIKGSGPSRLSLTQWGGVTDSLRLEPEFSVEPGMTAVVFLIGLEGEEPRRISNAYVFHGDIAMSELDEKSLPVDDLLVELRETAAIEASLSESP